MAEDVPSPIDLRIMEDARAWEASASMKRPWRSEFFAAFASAISDTSPAIDRVLELGSGPGFLAAELLSKLPSFEYVALDFSPAMHQLALARLGRLSSRVTFVERSFRGPEWANGLGRFGAVVTNQAVHELRHKRHAIGLHRQVREVLRPNGVYLVCDHFAGRDGMANDQLYMSVDEQRDILHTAGFTTVNLLLQRGGLVLHEAK
jgi:SAM-dependent methyltransferase